jgi:hypothetical protein
MLGTLTIGSMTLQTLELPWVPIVDALCGTPDASCIPAGDYQLARHDTPTHPKTFAFVNPELGVYHNPGDVPAGLTIFRTECLLHAANWTSQLLGCCALGRGRSFTNGVPMVTLSDVAMQAFQALVPWVDGHTVSIIAPP